MQNSFETSSSKLTHVGLPLLLGIVVFLISLYLDINGIGDDEFWLQRAGAVLAIIGTYIGFHDVRMSTVKQGTILHLFTNSVYSYLSLFFLILGTVLWGYGDFIFK